MPDYILFFDNECLMCSRFVNWLNHHDTDCKLFFAPLSGTTAQSILPETYLTMAGKSVIFAQYEQTNNKWIFDTRSDAILSTLSPFSKPLP